MTPELGESIVKYVSSLPGSTRGCFDQEKALPRPLCSSQFQRKNKQFLIVSRCPPHPQCDNL